MNVLGQIGAMLRHEFLLEWREKYAVSGILLYVLATVFIIYLMLPVMEPKIWVALFWVSVLFSSVNAVAKSFIGSSQERHLYYYFLVSPTAFILAKTLYNGLLIVVLSLITYGLFQLLLGDGIAFSGPWLGILCLGSLAFSSTFTMISAIASRARSSAVLMAILGLPLVLPEILVLARASKDLISGGGLIDVQEEMLVLAALNAILVIVSYMLFPYLWRD